MSGAYPDSYKKVYFYNTLLLLKNNTIYLLLIYDLKYYNCLYKFVVG
jgi:hypothetical protein